MDLILQPHCHIIYLNKLFDLWSLNRRQSSTTLTDIFFYMVKHDKTLLTRLIRL